MYCQLNGAEVRRRRGSRAYNGAHFARVAGISPTTLRRVERERGPVTAKTAWKIGDALGAHPREFGEVISVLPAKP